MNPFVFTCVLAAVLSLLIFAIPKKFSFYLCLILVSAVVVSTSVLSVNAFIATGQTGQQAAIMFSGIKLFFVIDKLTAFFILITNFTVFTGLLYSKNYLQLGKDKAAVVNKLTFHYFSYIWLYFSMLGVLMIREGLPFLIAWELMAVSSFMLILYDAEKRHTLKTAVNYLVQMHIGFIFLLAAFLIAETKTGILGFDAIEPYFSEYRNLGLFFLFFVGFAVKAGFMPFHTWLPEAHPAAPSHVSGLMSGVMLKMGIYGIIRLISYLQTDVYIIGIIILIISAVSGLISILTAIIQKDIKKTLAYSSIENIGIIGMGLGIGTIGLGIDNAIMIFTGFGGALLHVLNHSLFKSLMFFSAGSVYKMYHTRDINNLGGVIKKMPFTSVLFLIGSIAVCGLPPLNGFISEIIIFSGLFHGLYAGSFNLSVLMLLALIALALIGGLAIFCFTRLFGLGFLGNSLNSESEGVHEVGASMLIPGFLAAFAIIIIGLFPLLLIYPVNNILAELFSGRDIVISLSIINTLQSISITGALLLLTIIVLYFIRKLVLKNKIVSRDATWGCGYTAPGAQQQYTGSSFSGNLIEIAKPLLGFKSTDVSMKKNDIFPSEKTYSSHSADFFSVSASKVTSLLMMILKRLARLQTGHIQHYILYTFIFIIVIFVLLYLGIL